MPFIVSAATEQDLKNRIEEKNKEIQKLEEEIRQYQTNIVQTSSTANTLQGAINRINDEIKSLNYQLTLTQKKISKKELEISELNEKLSDTEQSMNAQQLRLAEILRNLYEIEQQNTVEILLQYQSLTKFFDAIEKNKTIEENIKSVYEKLRELKIKLKGDKQRAEEARKQFLELKSEFADQKSLEEEERKGKSDILRSTKNKEAQYQKLLRDREKKRLEIEREIQTIEDELRRLIDPSLIPQKGKGILLWPIANPQITQQFGITDFSQNTDAYKNGVHNGIDLRGRVGTPIFASHDGVVKDTGDTDIVCRGGSYGKYIVIDHPNNLSTLYAHLSRIKVSPGQQIKRSEVIGLSGNTGYSTGPHLHFTVYASNTFRMAKTVHCGLVPAGGYLNPLDYL